MSCNSCMIGGSQKGAGKIIDNTHLLKDYKIKDLRKLFKYHKKEYDDQNNRAGNLAIFSMTLPDSVDKVKEWVKNNKPSKIKKSVRKLKEKTVKELKNKVKKYKKSKSCSFKLNSKKNQLKQMVKNKKIVTKENATVKDLRASIKAYKKIHCPGLSKMKKSQLLEFINAHKIKIRFNLSQNVTKEFFIPTPEIKLKKEANQDYEKMKKIYNDISWDDLAVDGISVREAETIEEAHKKAVELRKIVTKERKKRKKRRLKLKKSSKKRTLRPKKATKK